MNPGLKTTLTLNPYNSLEVVKKTIKVAIYPGGRIRLIEFRKSRVSVSRLLKELNYGIYAAVVVKDGVPLTEDDLISDGDELEVYEVTSTG